MKPDFRLRGLARESWPKAVVEKKEAD